MDEINPKDYKRDARGNLVAVANIREIDLLRDELVMELVGKANGVAETLPWMLHEQHCALGQRLPLSTEEQSMSFLQGQRRCITPRRRGLILCS